MAFGCLIDRTRWPRLWHSQRLTAGGSDSGIICAFVFQYGKRAECFQVCKLNI